MNEYVLQARKAAKTLQQSYAPLGQRLALCADAVLPEVIDG